MKKCLRFATFAALPLALLLPLGAQDAAKDQGITRQQADQILNELRQIRQLLERQQAKAPQPQEEQAQEGQAPEVQEEQGARAKLNLAGFEMLGSKEAPLTIVEFTDYQCPFCQRFHTTSFGDLKKNYIDTGKVRFYSRDLPLDFHPNAMRAAEAARCASDQGQFWQLHDVMGANPDKLDMNSLLADAADLRMNVDAFRACVETEKYKNAVQTDVMEAMKIGANGTPTFVIGKSTPDGVDGELVVGAQPYPMFDQKLKELGSATAAQRDGSKAQEPGSTVRPTGRTVREEVEKIRSARHAPMPPAQRMAVNAPGNSGRTTMTVKNSTAYELSVFFDGPVSMRLSLMPGASRDLDLAPGAFHVAGRVSAANVLPFYGEETYASSAGYSLTFYIAR